MTYSDPTSDSSEFVPDETISLVGSNEPPEIENSPPLFVEEMNWGQQPVRLTAWRCGTLPCDAPTTSVHIIGFIGGRILVVRDRKGIYGFPGGRLEAGETREEAMEREVYEEARAFLKPGYLLFAVLKIEYTARVPGRTYTHDFSYMGMYAGAIRGMDPIGKDPAGIITSRSLFCRADCERNLPDHDQVLLREALRILAAHPAVPPQLYRGFLNEGAGGVHNGTAPR